MNSSAPTFAFWGPRAAAPFARPLTGALWAPVLLLLLTTVAFWQSAQGVLPLLGLDQAVGLAPAMPFLAIWLAVSTNRRRLAAGLPLVGQRELVVDGPVALVLIGAAAWLVWRAPQEQGWYYWSSRFDLLAAAVFALGSAVLLWGVQTLLWHRWAALYALCLWPEPLVRLQSLVAPILATLTAVAVRPLALQAHIPLAPVDGDPSVFASAASPGWVLIIGDACSGLNAGLTVAMLALPVAAHLRMSTRGMLPWMTAGVVLALLSNVVRVLVVLFVADAMGPDVAMGTVHPVLGAILLLLVLMFMWWCAPRASRSRTDSPSRQTALVSLFDTPGARVLAGGVCVLAIVFAIASAQLASFEPLAPVGPPGAVLSDPLDYVQLPDGWDVAGRSSMPWQNLFGPDSTSYAMSFRSTQGTIVKAQFVATPDRGRLDAYSLEACRVYHGDDVVGERTIDLGSGGVASLIDTWDRGLVDPAGRTSVLYWEAPFSLDGRTMHARLALFVVESDEGLLPQQAFTGIAPGGPVFDRADTVLVSLARGMAGEILGLAPVPAVDVTGATAA